jgi:hypothetical protein
MLTASHQHHDRSPASPMSWHPSTSTHVKVRHSRLQFNMTARNAPMVPQHNAICIPPLSAGVAPLILTIPSRNSWFLRRRKMSTSSRNVVHITVTPRTRRSGDNRAGFSICPPHGGGRVHRRAAAEIRGQQSELTNRRRCFIYPRMVRRVGSAAEASTERSRPLSRILGPGHHPGPISKSKVN